MFGQYMDAEDVTDERRIAGLEILAQAIDVVAAVLALLVVRMITSRQENKNRLLVRHLTWTGPPPPAGI